MAILINHNTTFSDDMRFPEKLWLMATQNNPQSVFWNETGETFCVLCPIFEEECLGKRSPFFKTRSLQSFFRQLNIYYFRKNPSVKLRRNNKCVEVHHEFEHEYFVRDRPDLLKFVQRKKAPSRKNLATKYGASKRKGRKRKVHKQVDSSDEDEIYKLNTRTRRRQTDKTPPKQTTSLEASTSVGGRFTVIQDRSQVEDAENSQIGFSQNKVEGHINPGQCQIDGSVHKDTVNTEGDDHAIDIKREPADYTSYLENDGIAYRRVSLRLLLKRFKAEDEPRSQSPELTPPPKPRVQRVARAQQVRKPKVSSAKRKKTMAAPKQKLPYIVDETIVEEPYETSLEVVNESNASYVSKSCFDYNTTITEAQTAGAYSEVLTTGALQNSFTKESSVIQPEEEAKAPQNANSMRPRQDSNFPSEFYIGDKSKSMAPQRSVSKSKGRQVSRQQRHNDHLTINKDKNISRQSQQLKVVSTPSPSEQFNQYLSCTKKNNPFGNRVMSTFKTNDYFAPSAPNPSSICSDDIVHDNPVPSPTSHMDKITLSAKNTVNSFPHSYGIQMKKEVKCSQTGVLPRRSSKDSSVHRASFQSVPDGGRNASILLSGKQNTTKKESNYFLDIASVAHKKKPSIILKSSRTKSSTRQESHPDIKQEFSRVRILPPENQVTTKFKREQSDDVVATSGLRTTTKQENQITLPHTAIKQEDQLSIAATNEDQEWPNSSNLKYENSALLKDIHLNMYHPCNIDPATDSICAVEDEYLLARPRPIDNNFAFLHPERMEFLFWHTGYSKPDLQDTSDFGTPTAPGFSNNQSEQSKPNNLKYENSEYQNVVAADHPYGYNTGSPHIKLNNVQQKDRVNMSAQVMHNLTEATNSSNHSVYANNYKNFKREGPEMSTTVGSGDLSHINPNLNNKLPIAVPQNKSRNMIVHVKQELPESSNSSGNRMRNYNNTLLSPSTSYSVDNSVKYTNQGPNTMRSTALPMNVIAPPQNQMDMGVKVKQEVVDINGLQQVPSLPAVDSDQNDVIFLSQFGNNLGNGSLPMIVPQRNQTNMGIQIKEEVIDSKDFNDYSNVNGLQQVSGIPAPNSVQNDVIFVSQMDNNLGNLNMTVVSQNQADMSVQIKQELMDSEGYSTYCNVYGNHGNVQQIRNISTSNSVDDEVGRVVSLIDDDLGNKVWKELVKNNKDLIHLN